MASPRGIAFIVCEHLRRTIGSIWRNQCFVDFRIKICSGLVPVSMIGNLNISSSKALSKLPPQGKVWQGIVDS